MDDRPIGLLDSGVGGLSVVKKVIEKLPNESTVFIGDNAHMPYGDRSQDEIIALTRRSVAFLMSHQIKLLIIACNTATAVAMATIQKEIAPQVIGVIQSGALAASKTTDTKHVAVVGTSVTIHSHAYAHELHMRNPQLVVTELATPKLAPLVEAQASQSQNLATVQGSLKPLQGHDFDTLILGCTHYPLIASTFRQVLGPQVKIVDPAMQVAQYTANVLARDDLQSSGHSVYHEYYTTGDPAHFEKLARPFLGEAGLTVQQVTTEVKP